VLPLALVTPQARHAHRCTQFPGIGLLLACDGEGALEIRFCLRRITLGDISAISPAMRFSSALTDDSAIRDFLLSPCVGKFDMYVEDECAAYVRYCFADPMDAAIFRSRLEPKSEPFRVAG
jgi:hypothetical protein